MTYETFETSQELSQPVEVYTFTVGATVFRYTSHEIDVTLGVEDYTSITISRTRIEKGASARSSTLTVNVPIDNAVSQLFTPSVPGQRVRVEIERYQRLDTPTPEVIKIFDGFIHSVAYVKGMKETEFACRPAIATLGRSVPKFKYRAACNHVLYDLGCKVDDTDPTFRAAGFVVTGVLGNVLTVSGLSGTYADGWFDGGQVESLTTTDFRLIRTHVGNDLTLSFPFSTTPTTANVFAGCGHSIAVCKSKFDNVLNFGGFPFVPTKNPFQTGLDGTDKV